MRWPCDMTAVEAELFGGFRTCVMCGAPYSMEHKLGTDSGCCSPRCRKDRENLRAKERYHADRGKAKAAGHGAGLG